MFKTMTQKEIGNKYYRALVDVKESKPYYSTARTIVYLLYTYNSTNNNASKNAEYSEKYDTIVEMLKEYVTIERHKRLLSNKSKWVVTEFNIPADICAKLGRIQRNLIEEEQAIVDKRLRDERLREQERKAKIRENIDKLL